MAFKGKEDKPKPKPAIKCSCGEDMVEIPFVRRDGTKLVRVTSGDLERIGGAGPREMGAAHACKTCDSYAQWPRSR